MANTHLSYSDYIKVWSDKATVTDWVKFNWLGENMFYIDLGTLSGGIISSEEGIINMYSLTPGAKVPESVTTPSDIHCNGFKNIGVYFIATAGRTQETELIAIAGDSVTVYIKSAAFIGKTFNECKALLNGVLLFYQPKEPM